MERIVVATANQHKFNEITEILDELPVKLLSLNDFPEIPPIEETGYTFRENALIKAEKVFQYTGELTLADDSGLEVDALDGAPGIYSARYAGRRKDYNANNQKLLLELKNVPDSQRGAQFRCVVAILGTEIREVVEGVVRGRIIHKLRGHYGFGYDPLFVPNGYERTYAELSEDLKNRISHRAQAFEKAKILLNQIL